MKNVYLLQHVHEIGDETENVKIIGTYSSKKKAKKAKRRVSIQPGFKDTKNGFIIDKYPIDKDHWLEGFVTVLNE